MTYVKHWASFRAFGLAFAIVLSPALMQTDDVSCVGEDLVRLEMLEIEIAGEDMITFDPMEAVYEVTLPEGTEGVVVRAKAIDPETRVVYVLDDSCPGIEAVGVTEAGGGEVTLESVPEGHSVLKVVAEAGIGMAQTYRILFTPPMLCE
jgi:hypothetical protein